MDVMFAVLLLAALLLPVLLVYLLCTSKSRQKGKRATKMEAERAELAANYERKNSLLREENHCVYQQDQHPAKINMYKVQHVNAIVDHFDSLDEVGQAIRKAGLESSNLMFGIDFTVSNLHQGQKTFGGKSLHAIDANSFNPYQQVIHVLGKTLESFADQGIIPAFGFGDASTKDKGIFPFRTEGYCHGFEDVLKAYNAITPTVKLSGPTNFAPLIKQAIDIVKSTKAYHILVIVADGQVTSEEATRDAIVEASHYPLSIIMVGVGDGPWDTMKEFDDRLPKRQFDNFRFVDFHRVCSFGSKNIDSAFAVHALMEIPDQYKAIRQLGLLDM